MKDKGLVVRTDVLEAALAQLEEQQQTASGGGEPGEPGEPGGGVPAGGAP